MDGLAARAVAARRSAIREVFDLANRHPRAIRLEIGEPSFTTPPHIIEAAAAAAREGFTRYTPNGGYLSLRELLADKIARVDGYRAEPERIVVTPGAMNALYTIYLALLDPGDEVLLPTPGFPNMDEMVRLLGGEPVFYPLRQDDGFLPDPERLEALITPRTKAVFMNTPGNPTGAVFPPALVEQLVEVTQRHGVWMISDEVYDELILDDDRVHLAAARVAPEGRIVSVYSFSKVYAMTGWRVGYCVAPRVLADVLCKLQEPLVSCPSAISQKGAEAALSGPREPIEAMLTAYRERRDLAWEAVRAEGIPGFRPQGTFYMLLDVTEAGVSSMDFTMRLLEQHEVAVAPGEVFGPGGHGFVRISFGGDPAGVMEGVRRIAAALAVAREPTPA